MCFAETDIYLPKEHQNPEFMQNWAVIACDQYTSDINYWNRVRDFTQNSISALNLIFPEIYLERENEEQKQNRIKNIAKTMEKYSDDLICFENAMFLTERTLKNGAKRYGIIGAVDLEEYSYDKNSKTKIRSTEETVISRLPPRVKIRQNAGLELPHIMVLYDDETNNLITALKNQNLEKIYDFKLMENSGSIKTYLIDKKNIDFVKTAINNFKNQNLLFAVGDGNHSLAAAKECYEKIKSTSKEASNHPARYALVEIVNIYDSSLNFEPIYRILFDVDPLDVIKKFKENNDGDNIHEFEVCYKKQNHRIEIKSKYTLPVKALQMFLDDYLEKHGGRIDYIHGKNELTRFAENEKAIGFICGTVPKSGFFKAIEKDGVLPRKTFSMGEADDKRFYIECKKIK